MAFIILLCIIGFVIYWLVSGSSRFKHDDRHYSQGPVMVMFAESKISIRGKTYDVDAVQGIESKKISLITTAVYIKVDDFAKPIHTVNIIGLNNAGEKFIQRLSTALRKAGGPSFY